MSARPPHENLNRLLDLLDGGPPELEKWFLGGLDLHARDTPLHEALGLTKRELRILRNKLYCQAADWIVGPHGSLWDAAEDIESTIGRFQSGRKAIRHHGDALILRSLYLGIRPLTCRRAIFDLLKKSG